MLGTVMRAGHWQSSHIVATLYIHGSHFDFLIDPHRLDKVPAKVIKLFSRYFHKLITKFQSEKVSYHKLILHFNPENNLHIPGLLFAEQYFEFFQLVRTLDVSFDVRFLFQLYKQTKITINNNFMQINEHSDCL